MGLNPFCAFSIDTMLNLTVTLTQTQTHRMGLNPFLTFDGDVYKNANANVKCEHSMRANSLICMKNHEAPMCSSNHVLGLWPCYDLEQKFDRKSCVGSCLHITLYTYFLFVSFQGFFKRSTLRGDIRVFHNSRLIRWIQQNNFYKNFRRDQAWNQGHLLNHYTRMFSVLVLDCIWILFMLGWFCPIHLIRRKSLHFEKKSRSRY